MQNYYRPAATVWARRKGLSFREWLKGWTMDDALLTVEYSSPLNPSDRAEDAAMWKWAKSMAPNLIHPDVYALSRPYQLVIP